MELKNKKYINNTKQLPGFADGLTPWQMYQLGSDAEKQHFRDAVGGAVVPINDPYTSNPNLKATPQTNPQVSSSGMNWGNMGGAITSTVGFAGDFAKSLTHDYSADKELMDAGQSEGSVNGISYVRQNRVDRDEIERQIKKQNVQTTAGLTVSGAAAGAGIGSLFPGAGTAIGAGIGAIVGFGAGLFAGGKNHNAKMRAVREAEIRAGKINNFNRSGAFTTAMQQDYAKQYGDTRTQSLYGMANGKISSSLGPIDAKATARVSNGEVIANKYNGTMYRVPGKKNNKDGKLAVVRDSDTVITNKYGLSDYVAATGDVEGAEYAMKFMMNNKYKCGKLPKCAEGWLPNVLNSGLGFIGGLSQYLDAAGQQIKRPNTYASNPYEVRALNDLYSLRTNPYPIIPQLYDQYAKTMSAIDRSGGLSGGQRTLARLAAMNNTQGNTAKLLLASQEQDNAYRAQAANAALNAGAQRAQRRMSANQYDLEYYSKAHAAQQQGKQMGIYNMIDQLQQYYANDFKRRQFNDTMNLYRQQLDNDKLQLLYSIK